MVHAPGSILLIGGGKMGEAILAGWLRSDEGPAVVLSPESFVVVNPGEERRRHLESAYGVATLEDASLAPAYYRDNGMDAPAFVLLCVKPQVMMDVLSPLKDLPFFAEAGSYLSIAAGITTERLEDALPEGAHVVRLMPNTPLQVGEGATGVCGGSRADAHEVETVRELFACLGKAVVVDEGLIDVVGALSGSGPAYIAYLVEALRDAAAEQGLDAELAQELALQTVLGTARMLDITGQDPKEARIAVCSPGGSTLAALEAMDAAGFTDVFREGVAAAVKRNKELAQC